MKLGLVTYEMGKDMTLDELFALCHEVRLEGLELRAGHAHGVEVELSPAERREVRQRFAESGIALAGLGSAFEYHSADSAEVRENVAGSIAYAQLAHDVGAAGIKVRPNGFREDVSKEATCDQIGKALREVAMAAADLGVEVRLEVHGPGTQEPKYIRMMMDAADHENATVCWNCNALDMDEHGSIAENFKLLQDKITHVHIIEIGKPTYPWQDLFDRLRQSATMGSALLKSSTIRSRQGLCTITARCSITSQATRCIRSSMRRRPERAEA